MSRRVLILPAAALVFLAVASASPGGFELGRCGAHVERDTLLVTGDPTANVIEVARGDRGVQITCDGVGGIFAGVEQVVVEGGDGEDKLAIVGTEASERFMIGAGAELGAARVEVSGLTITGAAIELLAIDGGDGDDRFESVGLPGVALSLDGQAGDDEWKYVAVRRFAVFLEQSLGSGLEWAVFEGGSGEDRLDLLTDAGKQFVQVNGVPERQVPDPELRVTDVDRDLLVADLFVQQTESVGLEAGNGDDRVEVAWDAVLMSGLSLIRVDLGNGDDVLAVHALTGGAPVAVAAELGNGDDLLEAAGEIELLARPGRGLDAARVTRNLLPSVAAFERVEVLEGDS